MTSTWVLTYRCTQDIRIGTHAQKDIHKNTLLKKWKIRQTNQSEFTVSRFRELIGMEPWLRMDVFKNSSSNDKAFFTILAKVPLFSILGFTNSTRGFASKPPK